MKATWMNPKKQRKVKLSSHWWRQQEMKMSSFKTPLTTSIRQNAVWARPLLVLQAWIQTLSSQMYMDSSRKSNSNKVSQWAKALKAKFKLSWPARSHKKTFCSIHMPQPTTSGSKASCQDSTIWISTNLSGQLFKTTTVTNRHRMAKPITNSILTCTVSKIKISFFRNKITSVTIIRITKK